MDTESVSIPMTDEDRLNWKLTVARVNGFSFFTNISGETQWLTKDGERADEGDGVYKLLPGDVLLTWKRHGEIFRGPGSLENAADYALDENKVKPFKPKPGGSGSPFYDQMREDLAWHYAESDDERDLEQVTEWLLDGFKGFCSLSMKQVETRWEEIFWDR